MGREVNGHQWDGLTYKAGALVPLVRLTVKKTVKIAAQNAPKIPILRQFSPSLKNIVALPCETLKNK